MLTPQESTEVKDLRPDVDQTDIQEFPDWDAFVRSDWVSGAHELNQADAVYKNYLDTKPVDKLGYLEREIVASGELDTDYAFKLSTGKIVVLM